MRGNADCTSVGKRVVREEGILDLALRLRLADVGHPTAEFLFD